MLCGCVTFASVAPAARTQEVLVTPQARVEVVGLKRWTVPRCAEVTNPELGWS